MANIIAMFTVSKPFQGAHISQRYFKYIQSQDLKLKYLGTLRKNLKRKYE